LKKKIEPIIEDDIETPVPDEESPTEVETEVIEIIEPKVVEDSVSIPEADQLPELIESDIVEEVISPSEPIQEPTPEIKIPGVLTQAEAQKIIDGDPFYNQMFKH